MTRDRLGAKNDNSVRQDDIRENTRISSNRSVPRRTVTVKIQRDRVKLSLDISGAQFSIIIHQSLMRQIEHILYSVAENPACNAAWIDA